MSEKQLLHTSQIRTDGGTQMRAELDPATIEEYAQAIQAGATFPPIVAYYDGTDYWLGDGFHRLAAYKKIFMGGINCEVRSGTRRDAVLCAAGANATHGRRRTNADKRRAVETLLRDEEWSKWSDRDIARKCAVSNNFVSEMRRSLSSDDSERPAERIYTTKHGTTATMNTSNIATANQDRKQPDEKVDREILHLHQWLAERGWGINYAPMPNTCYVSKNGTKYAFRNRDDKNSELAALRNAKAHEESKTPQPSDLAEKIRKLEYWLLNKGWGFHSGGETSGISNGEHRFTWTDNDEQAHFDAVKNAETIQLAADMAAKARLIQPDPTPATTTYQAAVAVAPISHPSHPPVAEPADATIPEESHAHIIRRALVNTDDDRIRWQQLARHGATDEEIIDVLLQVAPHTGGNEDQHWIRYTTDPERRSCSLTIYRHRSDTRPLSQMSTLGIVVEARHAWGIEKRTSPLKPAETFQPRPLTDEEAQAVVWRAIKHNCVTRASQPAAIAEDRRLWLLRASFTTFRDIINPGVTLSDSTLARAIASVAEELTAAAILPQPEAIPSHSSPTSHLTSAAKPAEPLIYIEAEPIVEPTEEKPDGDEYYTPPYIIEAARQVLGDIDLDPASSALAQTVVNAKRYYTKEEDGLTKPWAGTIWHNPPYSRPAPFVAKLIAEYEAGNITAAILLVNTGTETQWGQSLLTRYTVCFVGAHGERRSRISFWRDDPSQPDNRNRYSQMIFYLGNQPERFVSVFQQFGAILEVKQ